MGHRRGGEDKTEGEYERHHAIVEATHCIQFPASVFVCWEAAARPPPPWNP